MPSRPTLSSIAKSLRLSISTVSRALDDHPRISPETKAKVMAKAKEMHFVKNPAARHLRSNKTQNIGVILPNIKEEFFFQAFSGIEDFFEPIDYHLMVNQSHDNYEREQEIARKMLDKRIDGLLVSVAVKTNHYGHFKAFEKYGIPIVFFDRVPRNYPCNKVFNDNALGATKLIEFLIQMGLKRIALINGPGNLHVAHERLNGFLSAMVKHNLPSDNRYVKTSNLSLIETQNCMRQLLELENRPQAVITFNDYVAMHAITFCRQRGIKDIYFVSFANLEITKIMDNPPIASIEQFPYSLGQTAATLLFKKMEERDCSNYETFEIPTEIKIYSSNL
ncbi:LacI family transcriptional regulator [Marinilongibacter aquaticus]|uniref:LacI family DNA-binding transcriptional regulator n=1 Tax=Marinilongibacter aquaticus TaxID=2975157 RepID=UPI0021BD6B38|nr:LacI family DNA-binding transcriptional regulator [Marinilongibacter aquaticus]UBM60119.1 LacI family transcriptional regulator [Marinilongibacter aquaticus]